MCNSLSTLSTVILLLLFQNSIIASNNSISFNESGKTYNVNSDVNLHGKQLTVAKDVTINFISGSIYNGTIVFDNTKLTGTPSIHCAVKGSLKGVVEISWFLSNEDCTNDVGEIINEVAKLSPYLSLAPGEYIYRTPIVLEKPEHVDFLGKLIYRGALKDISSFSIVKAWSATININSLSANNNKSISQKDSGSSNVIGLNIINSNCCDFHINTIEYFNENLRISGLGAGCCYNKFFINQFMNANRHIRIYQEDVNNQRGWSNENSFYGGRLWNTSGWKKDHINKSYAVWIEGGKKDSYNKASSLMFLKLSMESFIEDYTIYAKNVHECSFIEIRNEGGTNLIKFVGSCRNNSWSSTVGPAAIDWSESRSDPSK